MKGDTTVNHAPVRKRTRRDAPTEPIVVLPSELERALADLRRDARDGDESAAVLLTDVERLLAEAPACDRGRPRGVEPKRLPTQLVPSWVETSWGMEPSE